MKPSLHTFTPAPFCRVLRHIPLQNSNSNPFPFSFAVMQILSRSPQFQHELENPAIMAIVQAIRVTQTVPESNPVIRETLDFAFAPTRRFDRAAIP
jgi:hypothetical protein